MLAAGSTTERGGVIPKYFSDAAKHIEALAVDKARLDWLESRPDSGANTLEDRPLTERGHVFTNKQWVDASLGRLAKWDHFNAPTVREAIDAAIKANP